MLDKLLKEHFDNIKYLLIKHLKTRLELDENQHKLDADAFINYTNGYNKAVDIIEQSLNMLIKQ